jgi:hypothetical protein
MPDAPTIPAVTASYKWPSKVLRYKITCPFQRLLIVKHEGQIDWSGHRIESAEALNEFVKDVMLPAIHRWMDPADEKSHYCRQIDLEKMLANPAPHIQEARDLRKSEGDEAARRFLLDHINRQKKEHFEGWWDYVMQGNPEYQKHPAFQYLILRPVLESSDTKTTRSPLPVNAEALALVWDRIKAGRVDPRRTKLVQLIARFMAFGNVSDEEKPRFGTDCRWIVIKRTDHNAAGRVAALSQGSGWCVASSGMAARYLDSSDFHLLVEDGRARVALRLAGNQAVEVQGKNNGDPGPWWPRILLYLAARGTRISHRNQQAKIEASCINAELTDASRRGIQRLSNVLKEQPAKVHLLDGLVAQDDEAAQWVVREAWLACVRADPMCGGMLPKWMEVDVEMKQAVEEAWVARLIADPLSFQGIPKAIAGLPAIIKALMNGWAKLLANDPKQWWQCPKFLHSYIHIVNGRKTGWIKLLQSDPCRWIECPESLQDEFQKDDSFVQKLATGWIKLLRKCPKQWSECPRFLQIKPSVAQAHRNGWIQCIQHNPRTWHSCPIFLREEAEIIRAFRNGWICSLERNPDTWNDVPTYLQIDEDLCEVYKMSTLVRRLEEMPSLINQVSEEIKVSGLFCNAVSRAWQHEVIGYSNDWYWYRRWNQLPEFVRQNVKLRALHTESWHKLLSRRPQIWDRAPTFVIDDDQIQKLLSRKLGTEFVKKRWLREIYFNPSRWNQCPEYLQSDSEIVEIRKRGWMKQLENDPGQWNQCPEYLQSDSEVVEARKRDWMKQLENDPGQWNQCPEYLQSDSEVVEARKRGWMKQLDNDPRNWHKFPESLQHEFRKDESMANSLRIGWSKQLANDPQQWSQCPKFLQSESEVAEAMKRGWMTQLDNDPRNWHKFPAFLQRALKRDAAALQTLTPAWIKLLEKNPDTWSECPDFLRTHTEIVQARKAGWIAWLEEQYPATRDTGIERLLKKGILALADIKPHWREELQTNANLLATPLPSDPLPAYATACFNALLQEPRATLSIVQLWKHSPRIELTRCANALGALKEFPWNFSILPAEQQAHPLIHETAVEGWMNCVTKHPYFEQAIPDSLRQHPKLKTTLKALRKQAQANHGAQALALVLHHVSLHTGLSDEAMSDLKLPAKEKLTWKKVTALRLKHWKKQVKADARTWENVPKSLQQDGTLLKLMREGLGPQIRQSPALWGQLPSCYRDDPALQRVHRFATGNLSTGHL